MTAEINVYHEVEILKCNETDYKKSTILMWYISSHTDLVLIHILHWGEWIAYFKDEKGERLTSTVRYDIKGLLYEDKIVSQK